MKPSNKTYYLTSPKKWYLQVRPLYRTHCIDQFEWEKMELSQEFCLIVTIRDNKRKHMVYDLATRFLTDNGFLHSDIHLKGRVQINSAGS